MLIPSTQIVSPSSADGWNTLNETWAYDSADAPTYTFTVSGDKSTVYSPGMKVRLTQATGGTKCGIITAVSYANPTTTVTMYMGTDYSLANEGITGPAYSTHKAPFGFPLDPSKWTVTLTDTTDAVQNSPTQNTWYNLGALSVSVPIGVWNARFGALLAGARTSGSLSLEGALSTSTSSVSDNLLYMRTSTDAVANLQHYTLCQSTIVAATKTTYSLIGRTTSSSITAIRFLGTTVETSVILVCAYL